jgi:general secretion pathway protein G
MMCALPTARCGFTLIEMLVVLVILSILAALVVPNVMSRPDDARVTVAKADLQAIGSALELYRFDNMQYPTTEQGLRALVEKPATPPQPRQWKEGGYLREMPQDPWGNPYQYRKPGSRGQPYEVFSYGADGKQGGTGYDQDIGTGR